MPPIRVLLRHLVPPALLALLALSLPACGNKGPLVKPPAKPAPDSAPANPPAQPSPPGSTRH